MSGDGTAYYLYCLAPGAAQLEFSDGAVFARTCEGVAAVLSQVLREEFCGEAAEQRLQDLAWLAPRACRHEAVVEQVMRQSAVLPARFATLFSSLESLERFIGEQRAVIQEFFVRLGGRREWAVKGLLDRGLAEPAVSDSGELSPGKRYLGNRRRQAQAREEQSRRWKQASEEAARELGQCASAFREQETWLRGAPESDAEIILNWAFLVGPAAEADFRRRVEALDHRHSPSGLSFLCSGPWPPYSFAPELQCAHGI